MSDPDRPIIQSAPVPRTLDLIFSSEAERLLRARYKVVETDAAGLPALPDEVLARARYIIGQPAIDETLLARLGALRCVFNVEGNLMINMPYPKLFERGIHVVTNMEVFASSTGSMWAGR